MKRQKLFATVLITATALSAQALVVGDIAFTGYNADGDDGYAFVVLTNIAGGTEIRFTDDEWNGTGWADGNEAEWVWTAPVGGILAGSVISVININGLYTNPTGTTANFGSITAVTDSNNNPGFSTTSETVYAYTGTRAASTLLAAISSDAAVNFGGLTGGSAVALLNSSDGAKYIGPRNGELTFGGYLPLIGNHGSNWADVGNGTGDNNFDTTNFTIVPEPASFGALALGLCAILRRRKK